MIFFHYGEFSEASQVKIFPGTERVRLILSEGENQNGIQERKQAHSALQRK